MDLQEIKDTYAQEQGYEDWNDIRKEFREKAITFTEMTGHENEICIRAQKAYYIEQITELIEDLKNVHSEYILERLQQEITPYEI